MSRDEKNVSMFLQNLTRRGRRERSGHDEKSFKLFRSELEKLFDEAFFESFAKFTAMLHTAVTSLLNPFLLNH